MRNEDPCIENDKAAQLELAEREVHTLADLLVHTQEQLTKKQEELEALRDSEVEGLHRIKAVEIELFHLYRGLNEPNSLCADSTLPGPPVELSLLVRGYDAQDFESDYPVLLLDVDFEYTPGNAKAVGSLVDQLHTQFELLLGFDRVFSEAVARPEDDRPVAAKENSVDYKACAQEAIVELARLSSVAARWNQPQEYRVNMELVHRLSKLVLPDDPAAEPGND